MIDPAVCFTHGSGTVDVHIIPTPRDDEVDHMPVFICRCPERDFAFPDTNFVKALLAILSALRLVAGSKHAPRAFDSAT